MNQQRIRERFPSRRAPRWSLWLLSWALLSPRVAWGQPTWTAAELARQLEGWATLMERVGEDGRLTPLERNAVWGRIPERVLLREPAGKTRIIDFRWLQQRIQATDSGDEMKQTARIAREWGRLRSSATSPPSLPADFDRRLRNVLEDDRLSRYRKPGGLGYLLQRLLEQVVGWFMDHFLAPLRSVGAAAQWFSALLFALLVVMVFTSLFYTLYFLHQRRGKARSPRHEHGAEDEEPEGRGAQAWWQWAERQAEAGDYREALRGLLRAVLLHWDERGLVPFNPAHTNWEILPLLGGHLQLRIAFGEWVRLFERKYYGLQPCSAEEYDQARLQAVALQQVEREGASHAA